MSNAVIHVAHKLWIIGGVLTLCFHGPDTSGKFKGDVFSMITINGPTTKRLIVWLVSNMQKSDHDQFARIMKGLEEDRIEKENTAKT